jgi:hypothetical protein
MTAMQDIEQMLEMINADQDMRREMEAQWSGAFSRADEMKQEAAQAMERIQTIRQRLESISVPFSPPSAADDATAFSSPPPSAPDAPSSASAAPASVEPLANVPGQATAAVQPTHKFCRNCGSKRSAGAAFCGNCGAKLS